MSQWVLVPFRYFLVLYYSSLVIMLEPLYLVEGGGDLLFSCFGGLGWPGGEMG